MGKEQPKQAGSTCLSKQSRDHPLLPPAGSSTTTKSKALSAMDDEQLLSLHDTLCAQIPCPAGSSQQPPRADKTGKRTLSDGNRHAQIRSRSRCRSRNPRQKHAGQGTEPRPTPSGNSPHNPRPAQWPPMGWEPPPKYANDLISGRSGSRTTSAPASLKRKRRPST